VRANFGRFRWLLVLVGIAAAGLYARFAARCYPVKRSTHTGNLGPASPGEIGLRLGKDASLDLPSDPPIQGGDLVDLLAKFTTVEACVREHASMDPLVADGLRSLGYDTFLLDACRSLEALAREQPAQCSNIEASSLRRACEATLASTVGLPEACPMDVGGSERGRDPACLGLATRSVTLCYAAETFSERLTCEATLVGKPELCAPLPAIDKARCERSVARMHNLLRSYQNKKPTQPVGSAATGTIRIEGAPGTEFTQLSTTLETRLGGELVRGAVRIHARDDRLFFGKVLDPDMSVPSASTAEKPRIAFELLLDRDKPPELKSLELEVPGRVRLAHPGIRCACTVQATVADVRGGEVKVTISGSMGAAPNAFKFSATIATFLRDVVVVPAAP
jgi:hypothetical protein